MKTRIVFLVLLGMIGLIIMPSCQKKSDTPVVGLLMDDYSTDRWAHDTALFIAKVNELGGKVICRSAYNDANKQIEQAKELIKAGVDILVVVPFDQEKAANIVYDAHKAGIRVLSYERLIVNCNLDFYISFDNVKVGELQANYLLKRAPKGNYALLGGPTTDKNSFFLRLGQIDALQPFIEKGDIKLVYDQYGSGWSEKAGYDMTIACLKSVNNKIDAIIPGNDEMAMGTIKALEEKGLAGKVLVAGQDGTSAAIENIVKDLQTMTVYKPIEAIAQKAAEITISIAKGEAIPASNLTINNGKRMVPSILLSPMIVHKGNIGMQINTATYMKENKGK